MTKSLEPTGLILLVTACGGVLRYMLQYSGLGDVIGNAVASANLPIVVVAFIVAALVRICVGSATVAMTMAELLRLCQGLQSFLLSIWPAPRRR